MGALESFDELYWGLSEVRRKLSEWQTRKARLEQAAEEIRDQGSQGGAAALAQYEDELRRMRWEAVKLYREGRWASVHAKTALVIRRPIPGDGDDDIRQRVQNEASLLADEVARLRPERDRGKAELLSGLGPVGSKLKQPPVPDARPAVLSPRRYGMEHPRPVGERNSRTIPQDVRIAVAVRDSGKCRQCGSSDDLHYDHVIPWSKGGANTVKNIQLLCGTCNRRKGADDIPAI